jgi:hypothetical protein
VGASNGSLPCTLSRAAPEWLTDMLKALAVVGSIGLTLLGGCETTSENAITISLAEVPAKFAVAYCATFQRCNPFSYELAFAVDDCRTIVERQFRESRFNDLSRSVSAGTTRFDAENAAFCLGADNGSSDAPGLLLTEACEVWDTEQDLLCRMFTGSGAEGSNCAIDEQCLPGRQCAHPNDACPGTCASVLALGMLPCTRDENCGLDLVCSNATKACVSAAAEGESCGGGLAPQCGRGHYCVGEDVGKGQTGVCRTEPEALAGAESDPCSLTGPFCQAGLSCVVETADSGGTLVAVCRATATAGGACHVGRPNQCPNDEYCPLSFADLDAGTFSATCQPLPGNGEACAPDSSTVRCQAGSRCDPNTNQCAALRDLGQSCPTNELCYSGNCNNNVCTSLNSCPQ